MAERKGRDVVEGLGERVRAIRTERRYTRKDLAARMGTAETVIYAIETDRRSISFRVALALARALGVSVADLAPPSQPLPVEPAPLMRACTECGITFRSEGPEATRCGSADCEQLHQRKQQASRKTAPATGRICATCHTPLGPSAGRSRYCPACRKIESRRQSRESQQRRRSGNSPNID